MTDHLWLALRADLTLISPRGSVLLLMLVDTGLSLCQETAERKLEAKATELQQLRVTIMEKDLCLERALANAERLKAQHVEKELQVEWVLVFLQVGQSLSEHVGINSMTLNWLWHAVMPNAERLKVQLVEKEQLVGGLWSFLQVGQSHSLSEQADI